MGDTNELNPENIEDVVKKPRADVSETARATQLASEVEAAEDETAIAIRELQSMLDTMSPDDEGRAFIEAQIQDMKVELAGSTIEDVFEKKENPLVVPVDLRTIGTVERGGLYINTPEDHFRTNLVVLLPGETRPREVTGLLQSSNENGKNLSATFSREYVQTPRGIVANHLEVLMDGKKETVDRMFNARGLESSIIQKTNGRLRTRTDISYGADGKLLGAIENTFDENGRLAEERSTFLSENGTYRFETITVTPDGKKQQYESSHTGNEGASILEGHLHGADFIRLPDFGGRTIQLDR